MKTGAKIQCPRCKGARVLKNQTRVHLGMPGLCFECDGKGEIFADAFDRAFAECKGDFYGFSMTYRDGRTHKNIARCVESDLIGCTRDTKVTKITEEQARAFFARYGITTTLKAKG